jgi:predicted transcriptional regulator
MLHARKRKKESAMHVGDICTRSVVSCAADFKVFELAKLMSDQHVADVIVVEQRGACLVPIGIVTFRDMVIRVIAGGLDPKASCARDVMSDRLETVLDDELIYDAIWHMRGKRVRRLPVVNTEGVLRGVLTVDDVAAFLASELVDVARVSPGRSELGRQIGAFNPR